MKKLSILVSLAAILLIAGCGTSEPTIDKVEHKAKAEEKEQGVPKNEEKEILEMVSNLNAAENNYDFKAWLKYINPETADLEAEKAYIDDAANHKSKIKSTYEVLYVQGDEAIILAQSEYRQDMPFNGEDNWNSNLTAFHIAKKVNGEWKSDGMYKLKQIWLDPNGKPDSEYGYEEHNEQGAMELVEKMKKEKLPVTQTLDEFFANN